MTRQRTIDIQKQKRNSVRGGLWAVLLGTALVVLVPASNGASPLSLPDDTAAAQPPAIPHVNPQALYAFTQEYLHAAPQRAFAIAPGGAWAWVEAQDTAEAARTAALLSCAEYTEQTCVLYAVNDRIVFDAQRWPSLWDLDAQYLSRRVSDTAVVSGTRRGQLFPDLRFSDPAGEIRSVHDLRGSIVLLHFWGSWCPPCLRELPLLDVFIRELGERFGNAVTVVLLQVREPYPAAREWLDAQDLVLPLYDSGATAGEDNMLFTAAGEQLPDRTIARVFPSSYVLDGEGRVLFSHVGPITDWQAYLAFFEHAVKGLDGVTVPPGRASVQPGTGGD